MLKIVENRSDIKQSVVLMEQNAEGKRTGSRSAPIFYCNHTLIDEAIIEASKKVPNFEAKFGRCLFVKDLPKESTSKHGAPTISTDDFDILVEGCSDPVLVKWLMDRAPTEERRAVAKKLLASFSPVDEGSDGAAFTAHNRNMRL